jgi:hypothetical protein
MASFINEFSLYEVPGDYTLDFRAIKCFERVYLPYLEKIFIQNESLLKKEEKIGALENFKSRVHIDSKLYKKMNDIVFCFK